MDLLLDGKPMDLSNNQIITQFEHLSKEPEQTDISFSQRNQVLNKLRNQDRTAEEETGLNILFLAVGFLTWYQSEGSSPSHAPLFLIPLDIEKSGGLKNTKYSLVLDEDETIVFNPTLRLYLDKSFGVDTSAIPEKLEEEQITLSHIQHHLTVFSQLLQPEYPAWQVTPNRICVAAFHFANQILYEELEQWGEKMEQHPIISKFCQQQFLDQGHFTDAKVIDKEFSSLDFYSVIEADSSQIEAIQAAKEGKNFVLDGPPGTGKSQTIVNIIAELVGNGKKVLFVSQKKAALDVVRERMRQVELGHLCLDLHDHNMKNVTLIQQLERHFNQLSKPIDTLTQDDSYFELLDRQKKTLNEYTYLLHSKPGKLGKTIYDLYATAAELKTVTLVPFRIIDIQMCTPVKYADMLASIHQLAAFESVYFALYSHPWADLQLNNIDFLEAKQTIEDILPTQVQSLQVLQQSISILKALGFEHLNNFSELNTWLPTLNHIAKVPYIHPAWLYPERLVPLQIRFERHKALHIKILEQQRLILPIANEKHDENWIKEVLANTQSFMKHPWTDLYSGQLASFRSAFQLQQHIQTLQEKLSQLINVIQTLEKMSGQSGIKDWDSLTKFISLLKFLLDIPPLDESWFNESSFRQCVQRLSEHEKIHLEFNLSRAQILEFLDDIPASLRSLQSWKILVKKYRKLNLFSYFFPGYYKFRHTLTNQFYKEGVLVPDLEQIEIDLNMTLQHHQQAERLKSIQPECAYGTLYNGIDTDWQAIRKSFIWMDKFFQLPLEKTSQLRQLLFDTSHLNTLKNELIKAENLQAEIVNSIEQLSFFNELEHWQIMRIEDSQNCLNHIYKTLCDYNIYTEQVTSFYHPEIVRTTLSQVQEDLELYLSYLSSKQTLKHMQNEFDEYGTTYNGLNTSWQKVDHSLNWLKVLWQMRLNITPKLHNILTNQDALQAFHKLLNQIKSGLTNCQIGFDKLMPYFDLATYSEQTFKQLHHWLTTKKDNISLLEEWIGFSEIRRRFEQHGLSDFIEKINNNRISGSHLDPVFRKRFHELFLDSLMHQYPILRDFRGEAHEQQIKEFRTLDKGQFKLNVKRVIRGHHQAFLSKIDHGYIQTQQMELRRLAAQKRPRRKIRQMVKHMRDLILEIHPCWMMSPLSVAQYIELEPHTSTQLFDTVIFDEASQIFPQDGISSIFRAKQMIVAGDPEQMPPNTIGKSLLFDPDDDEEEDDSNVDYESLLNLALNIIRRRRLMWHYRSKYEELINPSNYYIYNGELITFPPAQKPDFKPVENIFVPQGIFESKVRSNKTEASILVHHLINLLIEQKDKPQEKRLSIGIIAMGIGQQTCIQNLLAEAQEQHPELDAFFSENVPAPLFVKNLENVQGDERDIILLSIGYGKDQKGTLYQRFGPINQKVGYRRLNVAFTRAKERVILFHSFRHYELRIDSTSSRGLKFLRDYLRYAETGELDKPDSLLLARCESPFEEQVLKALLNKGYQVMPQVGCSNYRIDLAVVHPQKTEQFILGVECDGATYHSAKTARERDRLRQQLLEKAGWKIHRIWSRDWWNNPQHEIEKISERIAELTHS